MGCDGVWEGKELNWYDEKVTTQLKKENKVEYGQII